MSPSEAAGPEGPAVARSGAILTIDLDLQEAVEVEICLPWSTGQADTDDAQVRVTLPKKDMTLGEALAGITKQIGLPKLRWVECEEFDRAVFPISDVEVSDIFPVSLRLGAVQPPLVMFKAVDLLPVSLRRTGLVDGNALIRDEILGRCFTDQSGGNSLYSIAFSAEELAPEGRRLPNAAKVGDDGSIYVIGSRNLDGTGTIAGRVLWRLTQAVRGREPEKPTREMLKRAALDVRIQKAFAKAQERAREILDAAAVKGLDAAAKEANIPSYETGFFARQKLNAPDTIEAMRMHMQRGVTDFQEVRLLASAPVYEDSRVFSIPGATGAQNTLLRQHLMRSMFELAPEDVEPPYPLKPYVQKDLPFKPRRVVLIAERIGYRPVVRQEYEKHRAERLEWALRRRHLTTAYEWFKVQNVELRVGFEWEK